MAGRSEDTPFLADNDHEEYDEEHHPLKTSPANSHFKRPIKILTAIIALLSISDFGLLIADIVLIETGPFQYVWNAREETKNLAICLFINFLLSAPAVFLQIPILINTAVNIAFSIVILVFSIKIFTEGWPDSNFCRRWSSYPGDYRPLPETLECVQARDVLRITMGVSAGVGILIGILILAVLMLRIIAIARTKFWEGKKLAAPNWNPTGFTVQFTLSILPVAPAAAAAPAVESSKGKGAASSSEEGRLIET